MSVTVFTTVQLDPVECCNCGVIFGITSYQNKQLIQSHQAFYCPNGHRQSYVGKTDAEKLAEQLSEEKRKLANVQFEMMMNEKKVKRLEKRIKNGVCPCCHRQFIQLTRHMKTKHPEYGEK